MEYKSDEALNLKLKSLIESIKPSNSVVSCTIIKLSDISPILIEYNKDKFIYAASTYKVFIAAEVLRQIEVELLKLDQLLVIDRMNIVGDTRGDSSKLPDWSLADKEVSIDWLLKTMLSESSNTSANVLIDKVTRESVNTNIVLKYGWLGSEVTRKFLSRDKEDINYRSAQMTMSCSFHLAECLYLIEQSLLISEFVSNKMKHYMSNCIDKKGISLSIPEFDKFYHKIGSVVTNMWTYGIKSGIRSFFKFKWNKLRWQHDVGVVTIRNVTFVIAILTFRKSFNGNLFPMKKLSNKIISDLIK